jgi:tetratricopeptide (TPR) repeat protein
VLLLFLGRVYAAEVLYKRAYLALTRNEGVQAYHLLQRVLGLNPSLGVYHRLYAQANLFLVEDFLGKGAPNPENQAQVERLLEQAQREAKFLTEVWEPGSPDSWEVRAGVYRSLLGLVPTAAAQSEAAYQKLRALSPSDPVWPWQLANLYLALGESEKAVPALEAAVALKSDWPQVYYTLSMAYDAQKNETKVVEMLQKLVEVTIPGTPERERALFLLEQRTKTKTEER